jgi:Amiloride-sensitive sodium channel
VFFCELISNTISRFNQDLPILDYSTADGHLSQIKVIFKNSEFFPTILQEQLTVLDFISYCGGALGLFLGFSAMSAVEMIYYFTVRIAFDRAQKNKVAILNSNDQDQQQNDNYFLDIMNNSSIHGFNQVVIANRHSIER